MLLKTEWLNKFIRVMYWWDKFLINSSLSFLKSVEKWPFSCMATLMHCQKYQLFQRIHIMYVVENWNRQIFVVYPIPVTLWLRTMRLHRSTTSAWCSVWEDIDYPVHIDCFEWSWIKSVVVPTKYVQLVQPLTLWRIMVWIVFLVGQYLPP